MRACGQWVADTHTKGWQHAFDMHLQKVLEIAAVDQDSKTNFASHRVVSSATAAAAGCGYRLLPSITSVCPCHVCLVLSCHSHQDSSKVADVQDGNALKTTVARSRVREQEQSPPIPTCCFHSCSLPQRACEEGPESRTHLLSDADRHGEAAAKAMRPTNSPMRTGDF